MTMTTGSLDGVDTSLFSVKEAEPKDDEVGRQYNEHDYNKQKSFDLINAALENNASFKASLEQEYFKPTNIGFLDKKLKEGTITPMDAYMANKYFGVKLSDYGMQRSEIDLNAKVKGLGLTDLNKALMSFEENDELFNRTINGSDGKLGLGGAFRRWAFEGSSGFFDWLKTHEPQFMVDVKEGANALARARAGGGKVPMQLINQAEKDFYAGAKTADSFLGSINSAKKTNLGAWSAKISNALEHGLPISEQNLKAFYKAIESVNFLDEALGRGWTDDDYRGYERFKVDYKAMLPNSQNTQKSEKNALGESYTPRKVPY